MAGKELVPDDDETLQAALSFIDEFSGDEGLSATQVAVVKATDLLADEAEVFGGTCTLPRSVLNAHAPIHSCKTPLLLEANGGEATDRRKQINERKKLLRKAGVYGDPNRARNARRLEIAHLKDQIEKLQIDLQILQGQKDRSKGEAATLKSSGKSILTMQIPSMWQAIADSQRKRREGSELENVRLKLILDRQQKVADNLRSLMKTRARQLTTECSSFMDVSAPEPPVVHVLDFRGDIADFEALFRLNEAAYREVDAVFADNGLAEMVISPSDVHIREGVGGKYLELFANKILPFKLSDATEAACDHFKGIKKHASNGIVYAKAAKSTEPTIIEDFTKELFSNSSRADIKVKQVVRRYVEPDRDVVIWMSHVSPTEIKHKMLRGLAYHLRGYALTKRSPASTPERELSQLQFCSLISLDQEPGTRIDPAKCARADQLLDRQHSSEYSQPPGPNRGRVGRSSTTRAHAVDERHSFSASS